MLEFICKVTAKGFIFEKSYLSDAWNQLDFVILVMSILPKLNAVRTIRLLKYLLKLKIFKDLGRTVSNSVKSLNGLIILACLMIVSYAIIGYFIFDPSDADST